MARASLLPRRRCRRRDAFETVGLFARGCDASTIHDLELSKRFDGITTYDGSRRLVRFRCNAGERRFDVTVSGGCSTHHFHLTSPTLVVRMIVEMDLLECHRLDVARSVQRMVAKYNRLPDDGKAELSSRNDVTLCFS